MSTIKATCARCGEVVLTSADIDLVHCVDAPDSGSWYSFRCPACGVVAIRRTDTYVVTLLRGGGVVARQWAIGPDTIPSFRIDGRPVDEDDLIMFGQRLHLAPVAVDPMDLGRHDRERVAA